MSNTHTNVTPKLLAQGVRALRQNTVFPRLVNKSYQGMAELPGAVINIPIPSALAVRTVTPAVTQAANVNSSPTVANVTLDFWREAAFHMSDADRKDVYDGFMPMQASEAVKSVANACDAYIWGKHVGAFAQSGIAGTTPFSTALTVAASARTLLNKNLAPLDNRRAVIDPEAEQNLIFTNSELLNANERGDQGGIISGTLGTKFGIDWYMNQNVSTYDSGAAWLTGLVASSTCTTGTSTLLMTSSNAGEIKVGDIFTFSSQQYVITTTATVASNTALSLTIYPPLKTTLSGAVAITIDPGSTGTGITVNLMFHRDAFAWASRPLADLDDGGNVFAAQADPVSGIALRLEVSREYKQTTFAYDTLGGAGMVRRELCAKMAG